MKRFSFFSNIVADKFIISAMPILIRFEKIRGHQAFFNYIANSENIETYCYYITSSE